LERELIVSPSVYWDQAHRSLKKAEKKAIEARDYLEKALDNISEAREQL